jgi:NTP pyrophosphatase (non-canonical NTP hydrolase)
MNYSTMVKNLAKPGIDILETLKPSDCHILHMCMGAAGELGETIDLIKKAVFYRKPLDKQKLIEELGDVEFYLEGIRQQVDITREQIIAHNMEKLGARYSSGAYSDKQAVTRADEK